MDIACMEPIRTDRIVTESGFIHQIKWDGIRGVAKIEQGSVRIFTRKGAECTRAYPELTCLAQQVDASNAVLDGELVVFDGDKPSFYYSLTRNRARNNMSIHRLQAQYPVKYIVFDILFLNGEDLRGKPLKKRQEIVKTCFSSTTVAAVTDDFEDGVALFELMRQKGMEGIVSKRCDSLYIPGKNHNDWYKTKTAKKMLCAVTGIQTKNGVPASLILGIYRDGKLTSVGKVSSGLTQSDLSVLEKHLEIDKLLELTCWVKFAEWTHTGTLRHAVLLGFSGLPPSAARGEEISI